MNHKQGGGVALNRKYIFLLSLIMLGGLVFTTFMLLTENRYEEQQVETLVDYESKEDIVFFSSWGGGFDTKAEAITHILEEFQRKK